MSKTVEDLAVQQQSFPKGTVKLSEEKSLQKPPADATALTLANIGMADENKWTMVTCKGKSDIEMEEAVQPREQQKEGTPKRKEASN
eukprot:1851793-Ditylum_brightwellii.AAC.1